MERMVGDWEVKNVRNELIAGREFARQLQVHLHVASSPKETPELLVRKIIASYEKALSMLNYYPAHGDQQQELPQYAASAGLAGIEYSLSKSPSSLNESPRSEDSDPEFKDQPADHVHASKKRKAMPRWKKQVRVSPGMGLEGPLDDGFSWRKYGQKDILGAKYPRGYYRCTHRNVQGCLATKQVQRSDEDPTIFEVTYRGRHTCMLSPEPGLQNQESNSTYIPQNQESQQLLMQLRKDLRVETHDLESLVVNPAPLIQYSSSTTASQVINNPPNHVFSPTMVDDSLACNFPPISFLSPSSASGVTDGFNHGSFGGNQSSRQNSLQSDIFSASSSTRENSLTSGMEFPFDNVEFDPSFTFDHPGFLS